MNVNEKIALLAGVDIIMTEATDHEADTAIVDYFNSADPDAYEFLLSNNTSSDEILAAAIAKIQDDSGKKGASDTRLSANPYQISSDSGGGSVSPATGSEPQSPVPSVKSKLTSTTNKKDVTSNLAGTLPSATRNRITNMVDQRWDILLSAANSTSVGAYCVDTNVRDFLMGKTFVVSSEEYRKAFVEKYTLSSIVDDNEYGEPDGAGNRPVIKEGDNVKAFKSILKKLESGSAFNVRVPDVQNQKVIGILFNKDSGEEVVKPMKDVPIYVLTELGGKVPGQPGIEVTGIISSSKTKTKNGTVDTEERQTIAIKHRGKVDAMKSADSKYIKFTAKPVDAAIAQKEFGAPEKDYSVSSVDSFRNKDKEGKEHVVRVRGRIRVPFFVRQEAFQIFGPISASNRVEQLTEADKENVAKLYAAAFRSPYLQHDFANAAGLQELVADIEKAADTPQFNAAVVG